MNKILVTGADGLVGSRFVELFPQKELLVAPNEHEMDLTDYDSVLKVFDKHNPTHVVHLAAYTNVGEAEKQKGDEKEICWQVNVEGTKNLLKALDGSKTNYIHISTDMVFPGSETDPGPYGEEHEPESDPQKLTWYGFTKAEAERLVLRKLGTNSTIVRLIYPVRAKFPGKLDYLRKPLKLYDDGNLYPMFSDQTVSISFIDEISKLLNLIIEKGEKGVYHASSSDTSTPFELISYLIEKARGAKNVVGKASIDEFLKTTDNPVRYPKYGGLKVEKTEKKFGLKFSACKRIVDQLVKQGIVFS